MTWDDLVLFKLPFWVLVNLICIILLTIWGRKKRIGALGAFLWSLFLSPLVGLLIVGLSKPRMWQCDFCGYVQKDNFLICPKCKKDDDGVTDEDRRKKELRKEIEEEILKEEIRKEILEEGKNDTDLKTKE